MAQIHKWVNVESMLQKCFIGPLTGMTGSLKGRTSRTGTNHESFALTTGYSKHQQK